MQRHTDTAREITDVMKQAQRTLRARFHKLITPYHEKLVPEGMDGIVAG